MNERDIERIKAKLADELVEIHAASGQAWEYFMAQMGTFMSRAVTAMVVLNAERDGIAETAGAVNDTPGDPGQVAILAECLASIGILSQLLHDGKVDGE